MRHQAGTTFYHTRCHNAVTNNVQYDTLYTCWS